MRMQKRKFRIGHLAQHLAVERFVIRFWEKEFNIKPTRSDGGQRFYDEQDLSKFEHIKELLYKKGYTIAGAKKQLTTIDHSRSIIASHKTTMLENEDTHKEDTTDSLDRTKNLEKQLLLLKQQLISLQKRL